MTEKKIEAAIDEIKSLYPTSAPALFQAARRDLDSYKSWCFAMEERDRWDKKVKTFQLQLMASMKEADTLVDGDEVLITWKSQNRCIVDGKYLKNNYPDIWKECTKNQSIRYFKRKRDGNEI